MSAKRIILAVILVSALIFKFWLIAEMEVTDDPDDPPNYVAQILGSGPSFFGPGTGWFGKALYHTGIPFRDGIEALYLIACLLVVRALFDWPWKTGLALALFLFVYFNAAPEELFSHMESDPIWLVEALIGLSLLIFFAGNRTGVRWLFLPPAALCLGFATITRTSIIPLMVSFCIWAAISAVLWRLKNKSPRPDYPGLAGWAGCILLVGIFNYSACSFNSTRYHYFGISLVDSREYSDFYMALQSVGEATGDKFYPVDKQRLDLVAQAGPMSRWFVDRMQTDLNFKRVSQEHYGKYDLALPWFSFVVFFNAIPNNDLNQGFSMFRQVEDEIAQAGREGRLKVRPIIPLPDCRIGIVLAAVPDAARQVQAIVTKVPLKYAWAEWPDEPKFEDKAFTEALTRRMVSPSPLRENIGAALCTFYSTVYWPMLAGLELTVIFYIGCVVRFWSKWPAFSFSFLARQLFLVFAFVFFAWYVLFVASGLPASPRYMILQNVLLPVLLAYYIRQIWQMLRGDYTGFGA